MVSFAFWYEEAKKGQDNSGATEKKLSALINFNLWCQCGWKSNDPYLDIGFKVKNLSLAKTLFSICHFKSLPRTATI